jgi:hypothetical protein
MDFPIVRNSKNYKTLRFGLWICFLLQTSRNTPSVLDPLERTNLGRTTIHCDGWYTKLCSRSVHRSVAIWACDILRSLICRSAKSWRLSITSYDRILHCYITILCDVSLVRDKYIVDVHWGWHEQQQGQDLQSHQQPTVNVACSFKRPPPQSYLFLLCCYIRHRCC